MLKGGVCGIADSRIENICRMKEYGIKTDYMLLRTPMLSEADIVVENVDISLNSELDVISKLSDECLKQGKKHKVVLMAEMGDLREGIPKKLLDVTIENILPLKGIELYGIGMNLACFGGVVPTKDKIKEFSEIVEHVEEKFDINIKLISGGNSANIPSLIDDADQGKINNLRIGEGILLGLETVNRTPIPNTYQDAFILESELIEIKEKPSKPIGQISQNAFGEIPQFKDKGDILRGIVALGKQDVIVEDLKPKNKDIEILGSSSDHILLDLKNQEFHVGDILKFNMKYGALVHLYTSKYVKKEYS